MLELLIYHNRLLSNGDLMTIVVLKQLTFKKHKFNAAVYVMSRPNLISMR